MSLNVTNCPKCGRLMAKGPRPLCPNCHQEIEAQFDKCWKYLRDNRKCTLGELSEATGVSTAQITKFIREGRISIAELPNLSYECEVCGTSIREGKMCESCRQRLVRDVNAMKASEDRTNQPERGLGFLKDRK
ncbi:TIGR03826 family flagellar region protein [Paenibacillus sp.]|uniref:TIGR03826 family flagellar region protein n=1 Tax=Paenibacillus sp. TaxID=58172 RepID=UPI002D4470AA|nr:TIGR03826 family flagellar region protein [Paenibacillus sp.]HZG87384.1 TIGR03826 family flagellar region protein [Paenibacillus sp.]